MRPAIIAACSLLPLLAAGGCAGFRHSVSSAANGASHVGEVEPERRFELVGPIGVDVETFGGDVTIEVDEDLEDAVVTITRRGVHGWGRRHEAAASLAAIETDAFIAAGPLSPVIRVRATTSHPEAHFQRADVHVALPEADGVRIRTREGNVRVLGARGRLDVVSSDGKILVMTAQPMTEPVTIVNNAGDIVYRVRGESSGAIDGEAVRGRVSHRAEYGEWIVRSPSDHDTLRASFNRGTNPVVLRAADGDIRIAVVDTPMRVGAGFP